LHFSISIRLLFIIAMLSFASVVTAKPAMDMEEYVAEMDKLRPLKNTQPELLMKELNSLFVNYELSKLQKADAYFKLSNLAYYIDDSAETIRYADLSLSHIDDIDHHDYSPLLYLNKAYAYSVIGNVRTEDVANEAIRIAKIQGNSEVELQSRSILIAHFIKILKFNAAHQHAVASLKIIESIDSDEFEASILMFEGLIYKEMEDYSKALLNLKKAEALYVSNNFYHNLFYTRILIAEVYSAVGNSEEAQSIYAGIITNPNVTALYELQSHVGLSREYLNNGLLTLALDRINRSESLLDDVEDLEVKISWYFNKLETLIGLKDIESASNLFSNIAASKYFDYNNISSGRRAEIAKLSSKLHEIKKDYEEALAYLKEYQEVHMDNVSRKSDILFREIREKYLSDQKDEELQAMEHQLAIQQLSAEKKSQEVLFQRIMTALCLFLIIVILYAFIKQTIIKRKLSLMIHTDSLTRVPNRYSLMKKGEDCFDSRSSDSNQMSVILLDIDNFKTVNDTFGHSKGDDVLKEIAKIGSSATREGDWFGRLGGEEFVAILPNSCASDARIVAERVRTSIYNHNWGSIDIGYQLSASIGVASADLTDENNEIDSFNALLNIADKEMYKAKNTGKNRVFVYKGE